MSNPRNGERKGFTPLALIAVIAIAALLVGLIPAVQAARNSARQPATTLAPQSFSTQDYAPQSVPAVGTAEEYLVQVVTDQDGVTKTLWICSVCGYIHEGDAPPRRCPQCGAPASKFSLLEGEPDEDATAAPGAAATDAGSGTTPATSASATTAGALIDDSIYATVHQLRDGQVEDQEVLEGLYSFFTAECTEVGMYLAMSRQAERQGYPEVADAFKRYALEEAEHAAKFAELIGDLLDEDTMTNLVKRAKAEEVACSARFDIAVRAKELGYDAIHDTVHEIAKDEARHGAGFLGLLKRHFGK